MRKFLAVFLISLMAFTGSIAVADTIDLSGLTADELQSVIDAARLELTKYHPSVSEGVVLHEDEYIRITHTGVVEIDMIGSLNVGVIVENLSDKNLLISVSNVSCNGWAIWDATASVPANKKAKTSLSFMSAATDAELATVDDLQDIEGDIVLIDESSFMSVGDTAHVLWTFE